MKQKICISGNCVTEAIPHFLKTNEEFNFLYEIEILKPVFQLTKDDLDVVKKKIAECDIFLTQPICGQKYINMGIDTETIKKILKPEAKLILMPVPYFIGYFPEQFYLHDRTGALVGVCEGLPTPYHNKIIFAGYINCKSVKETLKLLYAPQTIKNICQHVADSLVELQHREENLSFGISDFVKKNYLQKRLFWTINHPTNTLIQYISSEILKVLKIQSNVTEISQEFLAGYITPILPSVVKELNLQLESFSKFNEAVYTLDFVQKTYHYYDLHPELVDLNKNEVENFINYI